MELNDILKKFEDIGYKLIKQTETTYIFESTFKPKNGACCYYITIFNNDNDCGKTFFNKINCCNDPEKLTDKEAELIYEFSYYLENKLLD